MSLKTSTKEKDLREIFAKYDTNGDGYIDAIEFKSIIDYQIEMQAAAASLGQNATQNSSSKSNLISNPSSNPSKIENTVTVNSSSMSSSATSLKPAAGSEKRRGSTASSSSSNLFLSSPSVDEILDMFKNAGIENDVVTYDQFVIIIHSVNQADAQIRQQFDFFDTDKSGKISKKELKKGLKKLKEDYRKKIINNMMNQADLDGDGEIDFDEFKTILAS